MFYFPKQTPSSAIRLRLPLSWICITTPLCMSGHQPVFRPPPQRRTCARRVWLAANYAQVPHARDTPNAPRATVTSHDEWRQTSNDSAVTSSFFASPVSWSHFLFTLANPLEQLWKEYIIYEWFFARSLMQAFLVPPLRREGLIELREKVGKNERNYAFWQQCTLE